jgi:hypothetical protein
MCWRCVMSNARPEWRGAKSAETQTGPATPHPPQAACSAFSPRLLILTPEGFQARYKSPEPLLHRVVLNMPRAPASWDLSDTTMSS